MDLEWLEIAKKLEARFFHFDDLPELSVDRNTRKQLATMFELCREAQLPTLFD